MAPSTLGTFLRSFTFGHVRQLDRVIGEAIAPAWALGAGPGDRATTLDLDSTICERQGQAGRRLRLHQGPRLPPAGGHPGRHGEIDACGSWWPVNAARRSATACWVIPRRSRIAFTL
jgi:hypothetical protein